jgi:hypothetical protein
VPFWLAHATAPQATPTAGAVAGARAPLPSPTRLETDDRQRMDVRANVRTDGATQRFRAFGHRSARTARRLIRITAC